MGHTVIVHRDIEITLDSSGPRSLTELIAELQAIAARGPNFAAATIQRLSGSGTSFTLNLLKPD